MAESSEEALTVARQIYKKFFAARPEFGDKEAVALILQVPSFHLEALSEGVLTGNLATRGGNVVIEVCEGRDLRQADKWWNGTVGGFVSWVVDRRIGDSVIRWHGKGSPGRGAFDANDPARSESECAAPVGLLSNLRTLDEVINTALHLRDRIGFDIDLEWVKTSRIHFHQLRPLRHAFKSGGERVELVEQGVGARFDTFIALDRTKVMGNLYRPPTPARWRTCDLPLDTFLLVTAVCRGALPDEFDGAQACVGIVDPTLGSRLSHFSARWSSAYAAFPHFALKASDWQPHGSGYISRSKWEIRASNDPSS